MSASLAVSAYATAHVRHHKGFLIVRDDNFLHELDHFIKARESRYEGVTFKTNRF